MGIVENRRVADGARHSFYTCNVGGVRASLFQCEEAAYPPLYQPSVYLAAWCNESSNTLPCFSLTQLEGLSKHLFCLLVLALIPQRDR